LYFFSPFIYQRHHIVCDWAVEIEFFVCHGVYEPEGLGVQGLAWAELHAVADKGFVGCSWLASQDLVTAVSFVGKQGVSDVAHVCSYLVGTACFQSAFYQSDGTVSFQNVPVCNGRFACLASVGEYCHAQAVLGVTSYVAAYGAVIFGKGSPYEGVVCPVGGVVEELLAQV
jgi:hypothetical protein